MHKTRNIGKHWKLGCVIYIWVAFLPFSFWGLVFDIWITSSQPPNGMYDWYCWACVKQLGCVITMFGLHFWYWVLVFGLWIISVAKRDALRPAGCLMEWIFDIWIIALMIVYNWKFSCIFGIFCLVFGLWIISVAKRVALRPAGRLMEWIHKKRLPFLATAECSMWNTE